MEVCLGTLQAGELPEDTFVAMRVGEMQKQSRIKTSKMFKFPDPGEGKRSLGRIEVFKRVGGVTVDFEDKLSGESQMVEVKCSDPEYSKIQFNVSVKGPHLVSEASPDQKISRTRKRVDEAQQYLLDNNVEELIAEAMRKLVHDRPENPQEGLCKYIMDKKLLSSPIVPPTELKPKKEPAPEAKIDSRPPVPPPPEAPPELPPQLAKPGGIQADEVPQKEVPQKEVPQKEIQQPQVEPRVYPSWFLRPSVGSMFMIRYSEGEPQVLSAQQAPESQGVSQSKEEPQTSATTQSKVEPQTSATMGPGLISTTPFILLPSVGSWLAPKPLFDCMEHVAPQDGSSAFQPKPFLWKPSVGSWLATKPLVDRKEHVAPQDASEEPAVPFFIRPSVGTWHTNLAKFEVQRPWFYQKKGGQHGNYINDLQGLLHNKDNQIEMLQRQLAALSAAKG